MKLAIVLYHRFELWRAPQWLAGRLRMDFPQLEVVNLPSYEGIDEQIKDAEIIVGWSLRPQQLASAHKLHWIHSPAAAVHQLIFPELVNSEVVLTNGRDVNGPVVAEHVMGLILALAKNLPQAMRFQARRFWGQEEMWNSFPRPREIAGATLGLVGLGSIGSNVARHASALGMRVIAVRENLEKRKPEGVEIVLASSDLNSLIERSDYIALTVPVTQETAGLMNAARFARMKPGACLINVGRGPLVDESALVDVLRGRKIGGAALDVFEQEPLPSDSPLWDLKNLLITPHTAGLTEKLWDRQYELISENLRRYLEHRPLLAVVDKKKGY
jgi:phosphoglycerate dehydrogenase-like enzyme